MKSCLSVHGSRTEFWLEMKSSTLENLYSQIKFILLSEIDILPYYWTPNPWKRTGLICTQEKLWTSYSDDPLNFPLPYVTSVFKLHNFIKPFGTSIKAYFGPCFIIWKQTTISCCIKYLNTQHNLVLIHELTSLGLMIFTKGLAKKG